MDDRRILKIVIFLTLVLMLSACSGVLAESPATDEPLPLGTLTMTPSGCSIDLVEDSFGPGAYSIEVVNETNQNITGFDMWRIRPEEQIYEGFAEHIEGIRQRVESGESSVPAPPPPGATNFRQIGVEGQSATVYRYLTAGTYGIVCFGLTGSARGMPMYTAGPIEVE